ncbi:MAG: DUF4342 domain-containing protein [Chloroflexota bacterium]
MENKNNGGNTERTWTEEIEIAGGQLVERVKDLLEEGSVRRLIIRRPDDEILLEVPLTAGAAVGGVLAVFAPLLAAVGAMAALVAQFKVEIVREVEEESEEEEVQQIDVESDGSA